MPDALPDAEPSPSADAAPYDLLIRNGTILDGSGMTPFDADIAVRNGKIVAVGTIAADARAVRTLDAKGCFVAPGFIDIHTHSDISILYTPDMNSSLAQGVTSEVVGNCGFSLGLSQNGDDFALERRALERGGVTLDWSDLAGFFRRVEAQGIAVNIASLAGHGTLRKRAMGLAERLPDAGELAAMQRDLADALDAGAIGLSSGLEYVPGMYADVAELTALARVAKEAGGFYATHLRDEGDHLVPAVAEALAVAEGAGIALQLSHHKVERPRNWGKIVETLAMVDAAEARGLDVLLDQYPYTAYQTGLATIALPSWAAAGTPALQAERLRDADTRARARAEMPDLDWRAVEIATCQKRPEFQGRTVAEAASDAGLDPRDWLLDLLTGDPGFVAAVHHALSEDDVERIMRDPRVMIGSDGVTQSPEAGLASGDRTHPRSFGTFPRVLARYVREKGLMSWEEAVRRMTSLPARRLGWTDRGRLAAGCVADITIFDPSSVADTATFAAPYALARGVRDVIVGGTVAYADGIATGARAGRVVRRADR